MASCLASLSLCSLSSFAFPLAKEDSLMASLREREKLMLGGAAILFFFLSMAACLPVTHILLFLFRTSPECRTGTALRFLWWRVLIVALQCSASVVVSNVTAVSD
eukprot:gb/GEZN01028383.1/.p1 GENE.gb/GEZN01028383.1/~~gb/GEZN01028383.1/.p1  ORF type:complete len:119 (+),score=20.16 gb/GEZN01028383.1/:43-357(+)